VRAYPETTVSPTTPFKINLPHTAGIENNSFYRTVNFGIGLVDALSRHIRMCLSPNDKTARAVSAFRKTSTVLPHYWNKEKQNYLIGF